MSRKKAKPFLIDLTDLRWILALVIILIGSLGIPFLLNVDKNSAFIFSSLVALLYLVGVNR